MDVVVERNPHLDRGLISSACEIFFATASQMHFCSVRVPWALDNHLWEQPSRWTTAKDIALYACSLHSVHNLCSLTKASFWNVYAPLPKCLFSVSNIKAQILFAHCNQNITAPNAHLSSIWMDFSWCKSFFWLPQNVDFHRLTPALACSLWRHLVHMRNTA